MSSKKKISDESNPHVVNPHLQAIHKGRVTCDQSSSQAAVVP